MTNTAGGWLAAGVCFVIGLGAITMWNIGRGEEVFDTVCAKDYRRLKAVLKSGVDPDYLFDGWASPLGTAIENDDARAAAILLAYGADSTKLETHERHLLMRAAFQKKVLEAVRKERFP